MLRPHYSWHRKLQTSDLAAISMEFTCHSIRHLSYYRSAKISSDRVSDPLHCGTICQNRIEENETSQLHQEISVSKDVFRSESE